MIEPDNNKDNRRLKKIVDKNYKKPIVSEEQKFLSKSKKQLKKRVEDMRADELWEDWENEIY
jgi:disulfide oxidoreductase YuzD